MCMSPLEHRAMCRDLERAVRRSAAPKSDAIPLLARLRRWFVRPQPDVPAKAQGIPAE
jgi:hypothetical protein